MSEGFKPCPICGRAPTERDIEFYDDGSYIGDMEMIHDFENVMDPSNFMHPDDWKKLDESDRRQIGNSYIDTAEAVEEFMVVCPCGFRFVVDRWTTRYPEKGWLDEVKERANRRWTDEHLCEHRYGLRQVRKHPQMSHELHESGRCLGPPGLLVRRQDGAVPGMQRTSRSEEIDR